VGYDGVPTAGRRAHYAGFDLLRIVAASAVVVSHAMSINGGQEPAVTQWTHIGFSTAGVAVEIFFVASGFLVAASWASVGRVVPFALRRFARIAPGLWCVLALTTLVLGPSVTSVPAHTSFADGTTWSYGFANAILVPATRYDLPGVFARNPLAATVNGSLWTLRLEVLAYAGLAVLGALTLARRRWVFPAVWFVLSSGGWYVVARTGLADRVVLTFHVFEALNMLAMFAAGAALYGLRDRLPTAWGWPVAATIALFATRNLPLMGIQYVALPYLVWYLGTRQWQFAATLRRFGDPSYGIYIYAFPISQLLVFEHGGRMNLGVLIAASLVCSIAAGYLSWWLVERPAARALNRTWSRAEAHEPVPVGA
jgi:peptidoglycan/LPS O-acetylase OafA/YrhL